MTLPIIEVKNLSKKYVISHIKEPYRTLRDSLIDVVKAPLKLFNKQAYISNREDFWALDNINFSVMPGEVVGIIGKNGAGKSTLLKILSQITPPTTGSIHLRGRVASLLEVGTGFHAELTGRENILLNGAILGMSRSEIKSKFNEIVEFSEIEKFLDTPVKRYSSGMYVRLAFAVAAHLEPEILIVDEVLAVGDAEFQKKCLGKMNDIGKRGRTVIFVSHNMNAIEQLCQSCIRLDHGKIMEHSKDVALVINSYILGERDSQQTTSWVNSKNEYRNPWFTPIKFSFINADDSPAKMPRSNNEDLWIRLEGEVDQEDVALTLGYIIYSEDGLPVYTSYPTDRAESFWQRLKPGKVVLRNRIPQHFLNEGIYRVEFISSLYCRQWLCEPGTGNPNIFLTIQGGLSNSPYWTAKRPGVVAPILDWEVQTP